MKTVHCLPIIMLGAFLFSRPADAVSWTQVSQKHGGCAQRLQRCERLHSSFAAGVRRISTMQKEFGGAKKASDENFAQSMSAKDEYLKNRIDRIKKMSEKIVSDIQTGSASSQGCPSCIVSSVDLFCRQVDALLSELNDVNAKIREYESNARKRRKASAAADDLGLQIEKAEKACKDADNPTANTILKKAIEHYATYKSLTAENKPDEAAKEKAIAQQLAQQALHLVSGKK
jgi:hypothetical protein